MSDRSDNRNRYKPHLAIRHEYYVVMALQKVLGGYSNVEDNLLHLPEGPYRALALRSFDPHRKQWSIWWLDGRAPGQIDVPIIGQFENEIGTFYANDPLDGAPIRNRFNWFTTDPTHPRWEMVGVQ